MATRLQLYFHEPVFILPPDSKSIVHIHLSCGVSGAKKEALAACGGNRLEGLFRCAQRLFVDSWSVATQDLVDLAPHRFDSIEVRRIGREVQQPGTDGFECLAHRLDLIRAQLVQDHQAAGA